LKLHRDKGEGHKAVTNTVYEFSHTIVLYIYIFFFQQKPART